jgi:lactoylglutathione lyase
MKIRAVEHIGIMVTDLEKSIKFYETVLDFSCRRRLTFGEVTLGFVNLGDFELELICGLSGHHIGDAQLNHLAFRVDDIDEAVALLSKRDMSLRFTDPMNLWDDMRCVFFRGPDGERLELFGR